MRHKPRYNNIELVYVDGDGHEQTFFANDVTSSKYITNLIGHPTKDSGSRFITDYDIDFEIDRIIMMGETKKRITGLPEVKIRGNNTRRGFFRKDTVIVTT